MRRSAMFTISFHWFCLLSCLSLRGVTAQPTTDLCSRDDDCNRQMAIMEQTLAILQSVDRRLLSVEKRLEEKTTYGSADHENVTRCRWSEDGIRSCYKVFPQLMTWSEGRAHCQGLYRGADLVSIETHAEDLFLVYMTQEIQYGNHHYFTSGRKDASGAWIWRATGQPFTYTGWAPDEPNNHNQREDACGFANNMLYNGENRRSVYWNDIPSSDKHGFICEFH